jgi:Zn-dependent M32 family carboxypeptidase
VLNTEIEDLSSRLRVSGGNNQAIQMILRKVAERQTLNSEERRIFSQCVARYRRKWDDLRSLSDYVTPIFERVMTLSERSKWALHAEQLRRLADQYGLSSPNSTAAINRIAKGEMLTKSETNAMEHLAQRLRAQGIEVLDLIRKE